MNANAQRLSPRWSAQASAETVRITNALSIDVEDWFQVSAFEARIGRASWDGFPCRVERNVDRLLALLATHDARATFVTLGWVAPR